MKAVNINGLNKSQNTNIAKTERTEQKPEEIMLFGVSESEAPEQQGKIKKGLVTDIYRGNIAGKNFDLLRRKNVIQFGYQTIGNIDGQKVDVKYDYKHLQRSDKVKENALPEEFGDVATLIFVENNDSEVREKREQERKVQEEQRKQQQQQQNVQNK